MSLIAKLERDLETTRRKIHTLQARADRLASTLREAWGDGQQLTQPIIEYFEEYIQLLRSDFCKQSHVQADNLELIVNKWKREHGKSNQSHTDQGRD